MIRGLNMRTLGKKGNVFQKSMFNQESRTLLDWTFTMSCALHIISNIACMSSLRQPNIPRMYQQSLANYAQNQVKTFPCEGTIYKLARHHESKEPFTKKRPRYASKQAQSPSIILTQPTKTRQITRTIKIPIPRLRRQNAIRHPRLPIPLRRTLRRPRPIKPPPRRLETAHLRLGIDHQPLLVGVGVRGWVCVGGAAGAGGGFGGAGGGEDGGGAVGGLESAFPAGAGADIVQVGGAVCVGLGPFAAEGGSEAVEGGMSVHEGKPWGDLCSVPSRLIQTLLHLSRPPRTSIPGLR